VRFINELTSFFCYTALASVHLYWWPAVQTPVVRRLKERKMEYFASQPVRAYVVPHRVFCEIAVWCDAGSSTDKAYWLLDTAAVESAPHYPYPVAILRALLQYLDEVERVTLPRQVLDGQPMNWQAIWTSAINLQQMVLT
jgi:hypothetical protein